MTTNKKKPITSLLLKKPSKKETNYNFRIDPEMKEKFDKWCKQNNTTPTNVLTNAIENILIENGIKIA